MAFQHTVLALIRRNEHFLLVKHRGLQALSWWLPGGVVKPGETLVAALQRELLEETGLSVDGTPHLAFVVQLFGKLISASKTTVSFFIFLAKRLDSCIRMIPMGWCSQQSGERKKKCLTSESACMV